MSLRAENAVTKSSIVNMISIGQECLKTFSNEDELMTMEGLCQLSDTEDQV